MNAREFIHHLGRLLDLHDLEHATCRLDKSCDEEPVSRITLIFEPTCEDLRRASQSCDLMLAYHPPKLAAIPSARPCDHVPIDLDASPLSPARLMASALGLEEVRSTSTNWVLSEMVKLVVFVPVGHEAGIIDAIARSGGGIIGNYSHCTYRTPGEGTFRPLEGANPRVGEVGRLETVQELRLETRIPRSRLDRVLEEIRRAHPYEEMAFDVYPLEEPMPKSGMNRILVGQLPRGIPLRRLLQKTRRILGQTDAAHVALGDSAIEHDLVVIHAGREAPALETAKRYGATLIVTDLNDPAEQSAMRDAGVAIIHADFFAWRRACLERLAALIHEDPACATAGVRARLIAPRARKTRRIK